MPRLFSLLVALLLLAACEKETTPVQRQTGQLRKPAKERRPYDIRFADFPADSSASGDDTGLNTAEEAMAFGETRFGMRSREGQAVLEPLFTTRSFEGWAFRSIETNYHRDALAAVRLIGVPHSRNDSAAGRKEAEQLLAIAKAAYGNPLASKPFPAADDAQAYALLYGWKVGSKNIFVYLDRDEENYWLVYAAEHAKRMAALQTDDTFEPLKDTRVLQEKDSAQMTQE